MSKMQTTSAHRVYFAALFAAAIVPACSLVFDGSSYRGGSSDTGTADAGETCTVASCGVALQYCDSASGRCMPGCDEDLDCPGLELCDFGTHVCEPSVDCLDDLDCERTEFCRDSDSVCVACDADSDGFAAVGGASCTRLPTVLGTGDCNDGDPLIHPLRMPDCRMPTDETCRDASATALSDTGFEVGATAITEVMASGDLQPETLHVFVVGSTQAEVVALVFAQLAAPPHLPVFARVLLGQSDPAGTPVLDTLMPSVTGAVVSMSAMRVDVDSVLVTVTGADPATLYHQEYLVSSTGSVSPLGTSSTAGPSVAPRALNLVANAVGMSSYSLALVRDGAATTGAVVFTAAAPVEGRSAPTTTDIGAPIAGRSLGAFRTPTGLLVWNGRPMTNFGIGEVALPGRATFASDVMGRTLAIGSSGAMITAAAGECPPDGMLPDCATTRRVTFAFGTALGSEPLLAADAVGNGVFAVGARIAGGVALTFLRSDPIENFGTSAFSVVVPTAVAPLVAAATDADIGVFSAPEGPAIRVTTGYGLAGMNRVRIGAVQLCMAPP